MNDSTMAGASADCRAASDAIDELPLPYIEMDAYGIITRANRATMTLHPPERGELVGRMAWELMATDEKDRSFAAYVSLMESGEQPATEYRSLYDRTGEFRAYQMHRTLIRDAEGRPAGMRMIFVNDTETKRALDEARRARMWLESVIASVSEAIIVTDALGYIRSANPEAEALFGWKEAELAGNLIDQRLPILTYTSGEATSLTFTMALEERRRGIATVLGRDGRHVTVEISTSPIFCEESGVTTGVVALLRKEDKAA